MGTISNVEISAYSTNTYLSGKNIYVVGYSQVSIQSWTGDVGYTEYGCIKLNENDDWSIPTLKGNIFSKILSQETNTVYFKAYNPVDKTYSNVIAISVPTAYSYREPSLAVYTAAVSYNGFYYSFKPISVTTFSISDENYAHIRVFFDGKFKGETTQVKSTTDPYRLFIYPWDETHSGTLEFQIADRLNPEAYISVYHPLNLNGSSITDLTYQIVETYD